MAAFQAYLASPLVYVGQIVAVRNATNTPDVYLIHEDRTYGGFAGGGAPSTGGRFVHTQAATAAVWPITHNLGQQYVLVQAVNGNVTMIPDVTFDSANACTLTFAQARSGTAIIRS